MTATIDEDHKELKELVRQGRVRMMTLDTSIAQEHGLRLNRGLLAQLNQFKQGRFRLVLSEIVVREITRRIADQLESDKAAWRGASNKLRRYHQLQDELDELETALSQLLTDEEAEFQVERFIVDTGAEILPIEDSLMSPMLDMYFERKPPFDASGKRNEFPDAIALLALRQHCEHADSGMIVVSSDNDWRRYCEQSNNTSLFFLNDLATALQIVNDTAADRAARVAARQKKLLERLRSGELYMEVKQQWDRLLRETSRARGTSYMLSYVADIVRANVGTIEFTDPALVRDDDAELVVLYDMNALCEFWAQFTFYNPEMTEEKGQGRYMSGRPVTAGVLITASHEDVNRPGYPRHPFAS